MLYTELLKKIDNTENCTLSPDLDIFTHHFPGNPILPGALSGVILSEACGGPDFSLTQIKGLRFRKPLTPGLSFSVQCETKEETSSLKICDAKIISGPDTIADGTFYFSKTKLPQAHQSSPLAQSFVWSENQINEYLPHGNPIILIHKLVEVHYPAEINDHISGNGVASLDQSKLVGTKIKAQSQIQSDNYWLKEKILPSPVLSELVAQAGALTLAPLFSGSKPQVTLLGCDTEYFAEAHAGATIETSVELSKVKRLGKLGNMIFFTGECFVGGKKIANVKLNAMAVF